MSPAVKFSEIQNDYDLGLDAYHKEVDRMYNNSLRLYAPQPEEEEEIVYMRRVHPSFARRLLDYLSDSAGLCSEATECIECIEDSLGAGKVRTRIYFPERLFQWLRSQKEYFRAYLGGKYPAEIESFFN